MQATQIKRAQLKKVLRTILAVIPPEELVWTVKHGDGCILQRAAAFFGIKVEQWPSLAGEGPTGGNKLPPGKYPLTVSELSKIWEANDTPNIARLRRIVSAL